MKSLGGKLILLQVFFWGVTMFSFLVLPLSESWYTLLWLCALFGVGSLILFLIFTSLAVKNFLGAKKRVWDLLTTPLLMSLFVIMIGYVGIMAVKDLDEGPRSYSGYCELTFSYSRGRKHRVNHYLILKDRDETRLTIDKPTFERLGGKKEGVKEGSVMDCIGGYKIEYLDNLDDVISVETL